MKSSKFLYSVFLVIILSSIFGVNTEAASLYTVKSGDTLWKISQQSGVSIGSIQIANNLKDNKLNVGQRLSLPEPITTSERTLLAQLVFAEAQGEPYAGKVAVATVVLNRVDSDIFPTTIREVIYERSNGYYAFSPVQNGKINNNPTTIDYRAVDEAVAYRGKGSGSLYFYNPQTAKSEWILTKEVTVRIGNHTFAK
ncbi:cell wall hydrolase [Niallia taxi]|uniref:cell wall hydrolase n=1 Tax=Niallia taxi TaxID=2499688 RepID=UPI002E204B57|nr:cell wall hydrolase [Niallia taxi]MED4041097.1 cell wall hydrolase [Niallia taxi]